MADFSEVKGGDRLLIDTGYDSEGIVTVHKVTKLHFQLTGKIEKWSKRTGRPIGASGWHIPTAIRIATSEDIERVKANVKQANLIHRLRHDIQEAIAKATIEDLEELTAIVRRIESR